jgi:hypothetical protein
MVQQVERAGGIEMVRTVVVEGEGWIVIGLKGIPFGVEEIFLPF